MSSATDARALSEELRLDSQNPWPGLTAFTESQHKFFYGREQESHELFSCVKRERLTVLFGKSGLGKTSLLQAGLFPQLRDADYLPVYVRLSYEDASAPFDTQLRSALTSAIEVANFAEVALPQEGESVWEYLHRRGGNLINDDGNVVMPVLIFDQFEECFTLGARKDFSSRLVNEFLPGLAEMIENRTPASLTRKLTDDRDLAKRYDLEAHGCRILITLREDYLANLEALRDSMPSLVYIDNRMRLTEMTGEQALSVVVDPSPDLVDKDVAESIVRFVAGAHTDSADGDVRTVDALPLKQLEVAPAILSLFCSQLNEERLKTRGMSKITRALVLSQGVTIIEDFYKKCIADMHPAVRRLIEDRLLTSAGYRDNVDLAEARTSLEHAGARSSYIDDLVRLRLLQIEDHRGVPRLELTHDVLAEPVKHSRDDWKKEQQRETAQQQERDTLLRAKEAEQEALKRTRFLQRMVAAAALVCLLLASMVVYGYFERKQAISNATQAEQNREALVQKNKDLEAQKNEAVRMKGLAQQETDIANRKTDEAKERTREAVLSANEARAATDAEIKGQKTLDSKNGQLTDLSSDILNHCVRMYNEFDEVAEGETSNAGMDAVRELYEELLLGKNPSGEVQCLALARKAHEVVPDNVDITDDLTMIPVRAAYSAANRHSKPEVIRDQVNQDFKTAMNLSVFKDEPAKDVTQIELARSYLAFAYISAYLHDETAQAKANDGKRILDKFSNQKDSRSWDYHQWDILAEANNWNALYLTAVNKNADATAALIEAFNDEKRASDLASNLPYYSSKLVDRGDYVAEAETTLDNNNDAAIQWYLQSLAIAKRYKNETEITYIYNHLEPLWVKDAKHDPEAVPELQQRIQSLSADPRSIQRDQDLAQAYRNAAELEEARGRYAKGVEDRAHVLQLVKDMKPSAYPTSYQQQAAKQDSGGNDPKAQTGGASSKPDDYDAQRSALTFAYSMLSWDEIFDAQTAKGIADTKTAIDLALKTKGHGDLNAVYENGINASRQNNQYDAADELLDAFTATLLADPPGIARERELATVVDVEGARIAEAKKQWDQAVTYRSDGVKRLLALGPNAYDGLKADLISAYGGLSFEQEEAGHFVEGIDAAKAGLNLDPSQSWIEENEANGLLLSGRPDEAKALYMKVKDVQWQGAAMSSAIADDLTEFCKLGYARPQMADIAHDLGIKAPELYSCLASAANSGKSP